MCVILLFQMLNIMEKMKENDRSGKGDSSEISLMPMNLSTMLNNTRSRDSSISGLSLSSIHQQLGHPGLLGHHPGGLGSAPGGDRRQQLHQQQHSDSSMSPNGGDAEMDEEEGVDVEDEGGSSTKDRARNPSAEIRAQFMADLRRLGGNIPTSSSGGGGAPDHPDSSVGSPPPPSSSATTATPTKLPPTPSEDTSLPPRKRKVSQEHHNLSSSSETTEKYNGIHEKSSTPTNGPEDLTPKDEVKDSPPVEVSN